MKTFRSNVVLFIVPFLLILLGTNILTSCNDENDIVGIKIQPDIDKTHFRNFITEEISLHTVKADPVVTDSSVIAAYLGYSYDSLFGSTKADFMTEFSFDLEEKYDSAYEVDYFEEVSLTLTTKRFYGDSIDKNITINVYELTNNILDSTYSDFNPADYCNLSKPLASEQVLVTNTMEEINIKLPVEFGNKIFPLDTNLWASHEIYVNNFKGLYITTSDIENSNVMRVISFIDTKNNIPFYSMWLSVKFREIDEPDTSFSYRFYAYSNCNRAIRYVHDYEEASIESIIDDTTNPKLISYTQSLGGLESYIKIPDLNWLRDSMPIAINKVTLTVPADSFYIYEADYTSQLWLENPEREVTTDYFYRAPSEFEKDSLRYTFILTKYINDALLNNEPLPNRFYITPTYNDRGHNIKRAILKNRTFSKAKLTIIYHKYSL